jgi:hypothetical protein
MDRPDHQDFGELWFSGHFDFRCAHRQLWRDHKDPWLASGFVFSRRADIRGGRWYGSVPGLLSWLKQSFSGFTSMVDLFSIITIVRSLPFG